MVAAGSTHIVPHRVAVVGAGMVGLATAWFLQERGVEVTVIDREGVAAGSSWGNAGWLTPGIATPLPEPAVLKYGLRAVLSPSSPVYVPPSANPYFLKFVAGFTRHSTPASGGSRWARSSRSTTWPSRASTCSRPAASTPRPSRRRRSLAAYRTADERQTLLEEIEHIHAPVGTSRSTCSPATRPEPSSRRCRTRSARRSVLHGQRFINPGAYVQALADAVIARGGKIATGERTSSTSSTPAAASAS